MLGRIAIFGLGLIGGSLALALRKAGLCKEIIGFDTNPNHLECAEKRGMLDIVAADPLEAAEGANAIIISTPPLSIGEILRTIRPKISQDTIVTDTGSVKGRIVEDARVALGAELFPRFVPSHPIAGTERNGTEAAFAELFDRHRVILTPTKETAEDARIQVERLWIGCGAEIHLMEVGHHDEVLAATSHLPHLLAYSLVDCLAMMREKEEIFEYAASGFADFTRIASSDPQMWQEICSLNSSEVVAALDRFISSLSQVQKAIRKGNSDVLLQTFSRAKAARDRFIDQRRDCPR
ncbi:MAG: prephenate dehydrogenase [Candidatus Eutrophobiaceae bacterium]